MPDYKKDWLQKADIDYFSQFMTLWLGFNSWYRSHYSDMGGKDRPCINKLKTDFTARNQVYTRFCELIAEDETKENLKFKSDLESFYYSLNRANIKYPEGFYNYKVCFETALFDHSQKDVLAGYINLIKRPHRPPPGKIELDKIDIINDTEKICACLMEILYQIRCHLFHGDLDPSEENHEVVKYCYFILLALIE